MRPGVTTDEIDAVVHEATIAAGMWICNSSFFFKKKMKCILIINL